MANEYPRDDYREPYRGGREGGQVGRGGRYGAQGGAGGGGGGGGDRRGIPLSDLDPTTTEASRKVIGCAIDVHKTLGPGYEDAVYAAALGIELEGQGVKFKPEHPIAVRYKDKRIGEVCADLFVEDRFIVEIMARPGAVGTFERLALRAQLKAADLELGLIINFSERRLKDGLVRVVNIDKFNHDRGMGHDEHEEEEAGGSPGNFHDFEQR